MTSPAPDDAALRCYLQWRAQHPGRGVPADAVTDTGFRLGLWVRRIRAARNSGTLAPEWLTRLEAIGFTWSGTEDRQFGRMWRSDQRWQTMLDELDGYISEFGDALVPASYETPTGHRLGQWLGRQHRDWRRQLLSLSRQNDLHGRGVRVTRQRTLEAAFANSPVLATSSIGRSGSL